jgi:hypothetical protein
MVEESIRGARLWSYRMPRHGARAINPQAFRSMRCTCVSKRNVGAERRDDSVRDEQFY